MLAQSAAAMNATISFAVCNLMTLPNASPAATADVPGHPIPESMRFQHLHNGKTTPFGVVFSFGGR